MNRTDKARQPAISHDGEVGHVVVGAGHGEPVAGLRSSTTPVGPILGVFVEPDGPHLEVDWTDEELDDIFGWAGELSPGI